MMAEEAMKDTEQFAGVTCVRWFMECFPVLPYACTLRFSSVHLSQVAWVPRVPEALQIVWLDSPVCAVRIEACGCLDFDRAKYSPSILSVHTTYTNYVYKWYTYWHGCHALASLYFFTDSDSSSICR
jgi:hypothetical protein